MSKQMLTTNIHQRIHKTVSELLTEIDSVAKEVSTEDWLKYNLEPIALMKASLESAQKRAYDNLQWIGVTSIPSEFEYDTEGEENE